MMTLMGRFKDKSRLLFIYFFSHFFFFKGKLVAGQASFVGQFDKGAFVSGT